MLSFANAVGNYFNRIGKLGLLAKQLRSYQLSQETNMTDTTNGVVAQLNAESDVQAIMGDNWISILSATDAAIGSTMQQLATAIANRQVYRDNPQFGQTLTTAITLSSLQEIIRQMLEEGATVLAATVSASVTLVNGQHFNGFSNGLVSLMVKRPLDGKTLENLFAETFKVTCSSDSYTGGATAGNEPLSVTGAGAETDVFAFDWPQGSGASNTINAIDGNVDVGSGNLLTNSGFETFTVANTPDSWVLAAGVAGTAFFQETTLIYDGLSALRIQGDGTTKYQWRQQFNASTGTSGILGPLTPYSVCLFLRRDSIASVNGVLQVDLVDQNYNIIQDENGVNNSFTVDLTQLTQFYAGYVGQYRTPRVLPTSQYLQFTLTTPYDNNRSFYMDKVSFGQMTQFYLNGPFLACHAGSVPFQQGDFAEVATTNSRGAGGVLDTFQTLFWRLYPDAQNNELLLPSSPTPTISDTLIG